MRLRDVGRFACRAPVLFMKKIPQQPKNCSGLFELECGGEEEDRTPDLCIANAALSQLSYPPNFGSFPTFVARRK